MLFYIDPGTGSMLFTILIGLIGAAIYFLRDVAVKLKFFLSGGRKVAENKNKIPIAIFTDHKRYWNVFEPLCDELEARKQPVVYMTASEDDPALEKNYEYVRCEFIGSGNKAFSRLNMLNASVVVSTTPSLDVFQWKRSRDVDFYIHVQHGANDISMYRMFGVDYFDAILLSGEYQVEEERKLEAMRNLPPKELVLVGIPYMDEMKKRLEAAGPVPAHERTILLAPSWGVSGILSRYGERIIEALMATGYHIIVRPHPQSYTSEKEMLDGLMEKYPAGDRFEWNRDNDNFELLRHVDLLISDFSGIIFDFTLVFDKPLIYADTSYDKSPYDAYWIEEEPWTFATLPKLGMQLTEDNLGHIKEVIDDCLENPKYQLARDKAREETWVYMGEGTKRTVDYIMEKYAQVSGAGPEGSASA